jgi:hypothetical protein
MTAPTDQCKQPLAVYLYFHPGALPPNDRRVSVGLHHDGDQLFKAGEWYTQRNPWIKATPSVSIGTDKAKVILAKILAIKGVNDVMPEGIRDFCVQFSLEFTKPGGRKELAELLKTALTEAIGRDIKIVRLKARKT